jgi:hypothetical protein
VTLGDELASWPRPRPTVIFTKIQFFNPITSETILHADHLKANMDPVSALGLAASVIAVIQLTGALIKPATSSLGPSENDEKELNKLLTTMTGFQVAYNNLEHYLKSNPGTTEALVTAIQQPIQDCKTILSELKLRLATMTFVRKHIIGKKWDKGFKRLVQRLDDARQLFDVILQGDQS